MIKKIFIGIDDTDVLNGGFGTGRVARDTAAFLEKMDCGRYFGVIRYQLLVDSRIRYTSHNSSKCIEFEAEVALEQIQQFGIEYLKQIFVAGSDPGICVCAQDQITHDLIEYGYKAQSEYLTKQQAIDLARKNGILLSEVGGSGEGIIGALASVGLRGSGNGGRYVQLRNIKKLEGLITVETILSQTDIVSVIDENNCPVNSKEIVDSNNWIRPNVIGGKPVLRLRLRKDNQNQRIWETVEQKHKKDPANKENIR
jgi:hypothetical protein